ncbi:hypothetical protein [Phenylobacterium sp.]|uniref:hypothetical protein n=1 Tax=Phenylobacterium sp. TaxID=1871053 RepID=UPI00272F0F16|nr:hypothetical protein [Phenylobacterium sp.]MDP1616763.1 hypothetical protein [Phenylobacterium sp.]MDP1988291.1 hypothetical protein [Phenylobacterium sp.]
MGLGWCAPAVLGFVGLAATRPSPLALGAGAAILAIAASLAWKLLGSRASDYALLAEVAARHRVRPIHIRRLWLPLNAQWRNPRQYEAIVLDAASQHRRLHMAVPLSAAGPVWVRLSLESSPIMQFGS